MRETTTLTGDRVSTAELDPAPVTVAICALSEHGSQPFEALAARVPAECRAELGETLARLARAGILDRIEHIDDQGETIRADYALAPRPRVDGKACA